MAFWPFWQPSSNKLAILIISSIVLSMLFVENKFFFFFLINVNLMHLLLCPRHGCGVSR